MASDRDVAACRRECPHDASEDRRLAGAVAAAERDPLAGRHSEVEIVDDAVRAELSAKPFHDQDARGLGSVLSRVSGADRAERMSIVSMSLVPEPEVGTLATSARERQGIAVATVALLTRSVPARIVAA